MKEWIEQGKTSIRNHAIEYVVGLVIGMLVMLGTTIGVIYKAPFIYIDKLEGILHSADEEKRTKETKRLDGVENQIRLVKDTVLIVVQMEREGKSDRIEMKDDIKFMATRLDNFIDHYNNNELRQRYNRRGYQPIINPEDSLYFAQVQVVRPDTVYARQRWSDEEEMP